MNRKTSVEDWASSDVNSLPDGSWETMMKRVANFHQKHSFGNAENNGCLLYTSDAADDS